MQRTGALVSASLYISDQEQRIQQLTALGIGGVTAGTKRPLGLVVVFGLLLSLGWIVVVRRSEAFHDFRYLQLIEAEATGLKPITTFTKADDYFSGESVSVLGQPRRLAGPARWARIYQVMSAVPIVFSLLWATLLAYFVITGV